MFKDKYRSDNEAIKPDEELLASLKERMIAYAKNPEEAVTEETLKSTTKKHFPGRRIFLQTLAAAACVLLVVVSTKTLRLDKTTSEPAADTYALTESAPESKIAADRSISDAQLKSAPPATESAEPAESADMTMGIAMTGILMDGTITITAETTASMTLTGTTGTDNASYELTDPAAITKAADLFHELALTLTDTSAGEPVITQTLVIAYNNGTPSDTIEIADSALRVNQGDWYSFDDGKLSGLTELFQ